MPDRASPKKRNGSYRTDGFRGWVKNWETGETAIWRAERENLRRRPPVPLPSLAKRRAEEAAAAEFAAKIACHKVAKATAQTHPYLARKGFPKTLGLVFEGLLLVPARLDGQIVSLQEIQADGTKLTLKDSKIASASFTIGSGRDEILCEGYATGLSIWTAATGLHLPVRVTCCFAAANVAAVAERRRRAVLVADNDKPLPQFGGLGAGEFYARAHWPALDDAARGEDGRQRPAPCPRASRPAGITSPTVRTEADEGRGMSKRTAHRRDTNGHKVANDAHARFYPWEFNSEAFQSLSCTARCLLLELKMLHNGRNNGTLFLSIREAARRIHIGKNQAGQAFADLRNRGFIRPNVVGAFSLKSGARHGMATSWVLTEFPVGEEKGAGSRDFMRWKPSTVLAAGTPKNIRRSRIEDGVSSERGHPVPAAGTLPPKCHRSGHTFRQKRHSTVPAAGTQLSYQWESGNDALCSSERAHRATT